MHFAALAEAVLNAHPTAGDDHRTGDGGTASKEINVLSRLQI
jgi:hypothetical protein